MIWLWVGFFVAAIAFVVSAAYAWLGDFDPEGSGIPSEGVSTGAAIFAALIAAGFVGALLHHHFT